MTKKDKLIKIKVIGESQKGMSAAGIDMELKLNKKIPKFICKFCGRPITLEESILMECGKKCYKKMIAQQQMHLDNYFKEELK